ncbi:hypothetical protein [Halobellus rarus]|uniref:DNA primase small subunit n=1 Tax=Halobellus rarus TaxID=1126237 RepID=A0ABD6CJI0_9EURY|nr:hypothetical protein [Halobellus rarus]
MSTYNTKVAGDYKPFGSVEPSIESNSVSEPFIRFAKDATKQKPKLRSINDPIPEDARFASPIYFLSDKEKKRQDRLPTGYETSDTCVAKEIQDLAEAEGRVYYPIYVESDAEVNLEKQIDWIRQFLVEELGIAPSECTWYFSGGRSIHVHTPYLANERQITTLRGLAKDFDYDLDPLIYSQKRQFRLPGITHDKGLSKVKIEPDWSRERIIREATKDVTKPDTFREVLLDTFDRDVLSQPENYLWQPLTESKPEEEPEPFDAGLNEWEYHSPGQGQAIHAKWNAHYSHPVSPYRNAGNGQRSLVVAKVVDGAYGEIRESLYDEKDEEQQIILPCQILQFFSCDREYQVERREYRPLRLSKSDYPKYNDRGIEKGDLFVLIGGQSRESIIHKPRPFDAKLIAESKNFTEAIEVLKSLDYETGASGNHSTPKIQTENSSGKPNETEAGKLQRQAENGNIEKLSHDERLRVANRLLRINGVNETRNWFKQQYGDEYDEELTNKFLRSLCQKYPNLPEYTPSNVTRYSI